MGGVSSTYFVLLTSDFYNVFSRETMDMLNFIIECGHTIGLHFDEARYPDLNGDMERISDRIVNEAELLGKAVGCKIDTVSMHRPGKAVLEADLEIPGIINSYGKIFLKEFKYLSDSRRSWREPPDTIIESEQYERLHILTHAFWYNEEETDLYGSVSRFVRNGNKKRYMSLSNNMSDLESIMKSSEAVQESAE